MTEQQPSVGRIVHYVSRGSADGEYSSVCRAAVVTSIAQWAAGADVSVDLCAINPEGLFFKQNVSLDEVDHRGGTWHWPERV